jgi:hypothetical protein
MVTSVTRGWSRQDLDSRPLQARFQDVIEELAKLGGSPVVPASEVGIQEMRATIRWIEREKATSEWDEELARARREFSATISRYRRLFDEIAEGQKVLWQRHFFARGKGMSDVVMHICSCPADYFPRPGDRVSFSHSRGRPPKDLMVPTWRSSKLIRMRSRPTHRQQHAPRRPLTLISATKVDNRWSAARHGRQTVEGRRMTPRITKNGDQFSVEIAPKAFIRWHVEPRREGLTMIITIDAPTLTNYARVDEVNDRIELPLRMLPQ